MGSSKKSKDKDRDKEHKRKRKHRSRSRDRHEKKKKDEKRRKRDYSPDKRGYSPDKHGFPPDMKPNTDVGPPDSSAIDASGAGEGLSLSIEHTNKIRAKLGLKPLEVGGSTGKEGGESKKKEDVHVPANNLSTIKKTEDLREKMLQMKEKRRINKKLGKVKSLAHDDEDEDGALGWVTKSRKLQEQKERAAKQAKLLEEMDAEFGIGDLVEQEFNQRKKYGSKDLSGLKVQHDQERFSEGKSVILTLKDKGVLDEEEEDTLVNVNMQDDERADKYKEDKKKKPDYNPYDDEFDQYGMLKPKDILDKYDEEIHGKKSDSFQLGQGGKYDAGQERRLEEIKREMLARGESLTLPAPSLAAEFYTPSEAESFNKVKKKVRKIRKKQKTITADDLLPLPGDDVQDFGSRKKKKVKKELEQEEGEIFEADVPKEVIKSEPIPGLDLVELDPEPFDESDIIGPDEDLEGVKIEEDTAGMELELALRKTRKLKQKKQDMKVREKELAERLVKQEPEEEAEVDMSDMKDGEIVLNATSEFCRSLGEIPAYFIPGNKVEEQDELMDFERELVAERRVELMEDQPGWQQVEIDTRPVQIKEEEKAVLDDEPVVNEGLAAALQLANKKGYLEKEMKKSVSAPKHMDLNAKDYTIEDKRYDDLDEKFRKRDRFMGGMVSDFKEKKAYKPDVNLEYIDEHGRLMNQKEAFRYLSHRFHGKGSGKKKIEKRQKKAEEVQLMKTMSSTDTPLGTVALLTEKQKVEKTHFIVLSGGGKSTATLSK